jgi:hypothetical protein
MKKNKKSLEQENLEAIELSKKHAKWVAEGLVLKLLIEHIVNQYQIVIDNNDGVKVWIENVSEDKRMSDEKRLELIEELKKHVK